LDYLGPDPKGRVLRAGKFDAIAVIPPASLGAAQSMGNPVFSLFLLGVSEVCDEVGANLVLVPDRPNSPGVRNALVDGFIFSRTEDLGEVEPARLRRLPVVVIDAAPGPAVSSVRVDSRAGARAAAQHLIDLGHRRFAILSALRERGAARLFPAGQPRGIEAAGMATDGEKYLGYAEAFAAVGINI